MQSFSDASVLVWRVACVVHCHTLACGVWRMQCTAIHWRVACGEWRMQCTAIHRRVACGEWRMTCGVWRMTCGVCSALLYSGVNWFVFITYRIGIITGSDDVCVCVCVVRVCGA